MSRKKVVVLVGTLAVVAALGGTGFYFREELAEMIPFLQEGNSKDRVFVEKVSLVMNQYTGVSNRYNGTVESQDTFEVSVDANRKINEIKVEVGELVEEGQTLVTYDTNELKMQIAQANLEVESINNDIENYNCKCFQYSSLSTDRRTNKRSHFYRGTAGWRYSSIHS